jgi:4-amino-4-deoxy-L-arabinose transferase-like glycosyltransferase
MSKYIKPSIFIASLLFLVIYHIFGYIGHYGYDDLHYAEIAHNFLNGRIDFGDHYVFRIPIVFATAASYLIFGISDFSSSLPAIIVSFLILLIVYQVLRKKDIYTLILGLSLTVFSNTFLSYSDKLMPDIYIVLAILLSLYILHYFNYQTNKSKPFKYGLLFSVSLLFGFTAKGTIVLIIPLLVFLLLTDIINKKNTKFWVYTIITGTGLLVIYFVTIGILTGDFLQRFKAISSNSYLNLCSYDQQSSVILMRRIGYKFFQLCITSTVITSFLFIVAYIFARRTVKIFNLHSSFSFWLTSAIILLLSANFMSISITSYSPMCLDYRHYLYLIPVAAIPASEIISQFLKNKKHKYAIIFVLLSVSVLTYFQADKVLWGLYAPLSIIFIIYIYIPRTKWTKLLFTLTVILALAIKPISLIKYGYKLNYKGQKEVFKNIILGKKDSALIITDDVQKRLAQYYVLGKDYGHLEYVNYNEYQFNPDDKREIILYYNWYTNYLTGAKERDLPYFAKNISPKNKLIYESKSLNIKIYKLNEIIIPEKNGKIHYQIKNGFEKPHKYWNQGNKSDQIKFEGAHANTFNTYSATLTYNIDSIKLNDESKLYVQCRLQVYYPDKSDALLVTSIEKDGKSVFWSGIPFSNFIKAYSHWWPVKHELILSKKEVQDNSILKVFIWNKDKKTAYIDNFEIKIIELPY